MIGRVSKIVVYTLLLISFAQSSFSLPLWQGNQTITWTASDSDNHPISFSIYYGVTKHGPKDLIWKPIQKNITSNSYELDTTQIPNGIYYIRLVASDGSLETEKITPTPIEIRNAELKAQLLFPYEGARLSKDTRVIGIADGDQFKSYILELSPEGVNDWIVIAKL